MSDFHLWRFRFIALVEDLFRELGFSPPAVTHDQDAPLAMQLDVSDKAFEIVHADGSMPDLLSIQCRFGKIPPDYTPAALIRLLQMNWTSAREYQDAAFGADVDTNEVICHFRAPLEGATAVGLLDKMRQVAQEAKDWQSSYFLDEEEGPDLPEEDDPYGTLA